MRSKLLIICGLAIGYVLGARAGRERYEQLERAATSFWQSPRVRETRSSLRRFTRRQAPLVRARVESIAHTAPGAIADGARATAEVARTVVDLTANTATDLAERVTTVVKDLADKTTTAASQLRERGEDARDWIVARASESRDDALAKFDDEDDHADPAEDTGHGTGRREREGKAGFGY